MRDRKPPRPDWLLPAVLVATVAAAPFLFLLAYKRPPADDPDGRVDAAAVAAAYSENGLAADAKYKGKELRMRGVVRAVRSGVFGTPTVELDGVTCRFSDGAAGGLARLRPGEVVRFTGRCTGRTFLDVYFEDCRLE